ncbi:MAG: class I SAM-dependent methyltransferase [Actinomycetota bacterium]
MLDVLKQQLLTRAPQPLVYAAKARAQRLMVRRHGIARALDAARPAEGRLDIDVLRQLDREFPAQAAGTIDAHWTSIAIRDRAARRIEVMAALIGKEWATSQTVLETGVGDGVMAMLMATEHGKTVTANDHQSDELDPGVVPAGVEFVKASASDMPLPDDAFDLVISHDAFEHFDDPVGALDEAIRVCRPGGLLYVRYGPLYRSSEGLHAGARLGVPFAPVLFERETIDDFIEETHREPIYHSYCNEWSLAQFRELFDSRSHMVDTVHSFEHLDLYGVEVISRYPDVFKRMSSDLDEFLVAYPEMLLRKR